jgi:hypothetical protein
MSSPTVAFRARRGVSVPTQAGADERHERMVRHRVGIAWALLFFNTLTYFAHSSVLPFPGIVGKAIAQSTLPAALLVVLSINRKALVRPNVLLCLVTLLVVGTVLTDAAARAFRHDWDIYLTGVELVAAAGGRPFSMEGSLLDAPGSAGDPSPTLLVPGAASCRRGGPGSGPDHARRLAPAHGRRPGRGCVSCAG